MAIYTPPSEKAKLIAMFVSQVKCTEEVAREYLLSEEWLYTEAIFIWNSDQRDIRINGELKEPQS